MGKSHDKNKYILFMFIFPKTNSIKTKSEIVRKTYLEPPQTIAIKLVEIPANKP